MTLRRILIANRGEIAVRIIRTCHRLGIEAVLGASAADLDSVPARLADAVICLGPAEPAASYLDAVAVVAAARAARADAVHPGYGFLAESPRLARACAAAGITFIGPSADVLAAAGDKLAAREHALAAGLPVLPGGEVHDPAQARRLAAEIGWPLLVKAAGGGGGRGIRLVTQPGELGDAVHRAMAEAGAAFGDTRVYLERFVTRGRHIEVQLLGDGDTMLRLGDRDCSVQRRYQKLAEEAPAPGLGEGLRAGLDQAAAALGKQLRYHGAGTAEFLVDCDRGAFYFLELNARIQVEHPVTEAVCGVDLVAEQIALAEGRLLRPGHSAAHRSRTLCRTPSRGAGARARARVPDQRRRLGQRLPARPRRYTGSCFSGGGGGQGGHPRAAGHAGAAVLRLAAGQGDRVRPGPGRGGAAAARRAGPVPDHRGADQPGAARGAGRGRRVRRRGRGHRVGRAVPAAGGR